MSITSRGQYECGSAEYGNFCSYYSFYPPDQRVQHLPFDMILAITNNPICLDIGSNTGELTVAIYNKIISSNKDGTCNILGVDLDPLLIERAVKTNSIDCIQFECANVFSDDFDKLCDSFLSTHSKFNFDIIFIFSVTMWIHLNYGDDGLKLFLKNMSKKANLIILEPQPWKCYKAAVRRRKRAKKDNFKYWNEIKLRETVETDLYHYLCNDCSFQCLWKSEKTIWGREISLYKRIEK